MEIHLWKIVCFVCILLLNPTGSFSQSDVCGQAPLNNKIIGGKDAAYGSWPWQVRLQIKGGFCGGSLINENWVLSAAHCFPSDTQISPSEIIVYLGLENLERPYPHMQQRRANSLYIHESFDPVINENDIALVKLSSSVIFTYSIRPVCLAGETDSLPDGTKVWVTGWGLTKNGTFPEKLQEVQVPIVNNSFCARIYGVFSITDNMICAGYAQGGKDSCQGDSGGPMVYKLNESWTQFGIVSSGDNCALPNYPGVYTRVSCYQDWINETISNDQLGIVTFPFSYHVFPIFFCLLFHFSINPFLFSISTF